MPRPPPPPPQHPFSSSFFFFYLFSFTFQKKIFFFFFWGGYHLANSSSLKKKFTILPPPPPTNIHFHLLFLSISFPSLFKKNKTIFFFWGGGEFTTCPTHPLSKNYNCIKYVQIPPPPPNIHFIFLLFLSIFSPSLFKKKKI